MGPSYTCDDMGAMVVFERWRKDILLTAACTSVPRALFAGLVIFLQKPDFRSTACDQPPVLDSSCKTRHSAKVHAGTVSTLAAWKLPNAHTLQLDASGGQKAQQLQRSSNVT